MEYWREGGSAWEYDSQRILIKDETSPALILREALAHSHLPMVLTDPECRLLFANQHACAVLGLVADGDGWERGDGDESENRDIDVRLDQHVSSGDDGWHQLGITDFGGGADEVHGKVFARLGNEQGGRTEEAALTRREREILGLVATGLRTDEIADRLAVSPETVKSHVHNAMTKLRAHTRSQAVAIALTTGQVAYTGGRFSPR